MKTFKINVSFKKLLADTTTPVSIYLRLRDVFPNSLLLESSDYHSRENSMSYVCCDPIAGILIQNDELKKTYPNGSSETLKEYNLTDEVYAVRKSFESNADTSLKFITDGLIG
nr:anthranilate synthase component I family protein [Pseudopedobacter sp.]